MRRRLVIFYLEGEIIAILNHNVSIDMEMIIKFNYNICCCSLSFICCSEGLSTINQQSSELAKAFMFWPSPDVREGPSVYDIR